MYTYIYIYVHTYIDIHIFIHIYTCIMYANSRYVYIQENIYLYTYIYINDIHISATLAGKPKNALILRLSWRDTA